MFERLYFHSSSFIVIVIVFFSSMLSLSIQLLLLYYFVLCSVSINYPPQDPIIWSSAAERTKGRLVRALGSTPSAATLLGSYLREQWNPVEVERVYPRASLGALHKTYIFRHYWEWNRDSSDIQFTHQ